MRLGDILRDKKETKITTLGKVLLSFQDIKEHLESFSKMVNKRSKNVDTFFNDYNDKKLNDTNTELGLLKIVNSDGFIQLNNFPFKKNYIVGPILNKNNIIFYNEKDELLLFYSFTPLEYLYLNNKFYDYDVRDLKLKVYDNFSKYNFDRYISNKTYSELDFHDIYKNQKITMRLAEKLILQLLRPSYVQFFDVEKIVPYKWKLINNNAPKISKNKELQNV